MRIARRVHCEYERDSLLRNKRFNAKGAKVFAKERKELQRNAKRFPSRNFANSFALRFLMGRRAYREHTKSEAPSLRQDQSRLAGTRQARGWLPRTRYCLSNHQPARHDYLNSCRQSRNRLVLRRSLVTDGRWESGLSRGASLTVSFLSA